MYPIRTALLALALVACTGGTTPGAEPVPQPEVAPVDPPAPVVAEAPVDTLQSYADALVRNVGDFEEVALPPSSEGDLERRTKGFRKGDELLVLVDEVSVGEYAHQRSTYVLKDGALVRWTRSGFSHEPTDDDDMRFVYFDDEVVMAEDGTVLRSRRRQKDGQGSGLQMDLSEAEWAEVEPPMQDIDLQEAMGRLPL